MAYRHKVFLLFALMLGFPCAMAADVLPAGAAPPFTHSQEAAKTRSLGPREPAELPPRSGAGMRRKVAMACVFMTGFITVLRLGWVRRRAAQAKHMGTDTYAKDS